VYVIPRFEHLFTIINKDPGKLTQLFFLISASLRSGYSLRKLFVVTSFIGSLGILTWLKKKETSAFDKLFIRAPLIGNLVTRYSSSLFLQALGLLVQSGIPLVNALKGAADIVTNKVLKEKISYITTQVESGVALSQACSMHPEIFLKHAQALFAIGEASGSLGTMVHKAAEIYKAELNSLLNKWVKGIPIACLLLLGVLIAFLVIAIYAPLLTLSR
jgi:type IV pilus assembly protein PilC